MCSTATARTLSRAALDGTQEHCHEDDTFGFGLVHGFGFSVALRQMMQFARSHLMTSLLAFNVGVEVGQTFVLVLFHSRAGGPLPFRYRRTDRDDNLFRRVGSYWLALDD